jgi:hypothetical protein
VIHYKAKVYLREVTMLKVLLVSLLCSSLMFLNPTTATAGLMTVQDVTHRDGSLSEELIKNIDKPEVQKKLAGFGITPAEAKLRVAALSDKEIKDMINSKGSLQAGGDVIIGLTTVLLIIIIVLLIR